MLWNPAIVERASEFGITEATARPLCIAAIPIKARGVSELPAAYELIPQEHFDVLFTIDNLVVTVNPDLLAPWPGPEGSDLFLNGRSWPMLELLCHSIRTWRISGAASRAWPT